MKKVKNARIKWIQTWFKKNGPDAKAIIGISGGKDSATVAALCVAALGKKRVIGVLMPNGAQKDIDVSKAIVKHLGIKSYTVNIEHGNDALLDSIRDSGVGLVEYSKINTPARLRMATLYAIAGTLNGRVANTCNLSEDYVGYATKFGDGAGDFSPLSNLTVQEVKKLAYDLGLPAKFVEKVPTDGLSHGLTDEEKLGFTYKQLDAYIRKEPGWEKNFDTPAAAKAFKAKVESMHKANLHKLERLPAYGA